MLSWPSSSAEEVVDVVRPPESGVVSSRSVVFTLNGACSAVVTLDRLYLSVTIDSFSLLVLTSDTSCCLAVVLEPSCFSVLVAEPLSSLVVVSSRSARSVLTSGLGWTSVVVRCGGGGSSSPPGGLSSPPDTSSSPAEGRGGVRGGCLSDGPVTPSSAGGGGPRLDSAPGATAVELGGGREWPLTGPGRAALVGGVDCSREATIRAISDWSADRAGAGSGAGRSVVESGTGAGSLGEGGTSGGGNRRSGTSTGWVEAGSVAADGCVGAESDTSSG